MVDIVVDDQDSPPARLQRAAAGAAGRAPVTRRLDGFQAQHEFAALAEAALRAFSVPPCSSAIVSRGSAPRPGRLRPVSSLLST
jgi:hypothetical protein